MQTLSFLREKIAEAKKTAGGPHTPSEKTVLQLARVVDLLERIGGPEAAKVLDEVAAAYPAVPIAGDATRASQRLRKRIP
jgi:hypothetical protein